MLQASSNQVQWSHLDILRTFQRLDNEQIWLKAQGYQLDYERGGRDPSQTRAENREFA